MYRRALPLALAGILLACGGASTSTTDGQAGTAEPAVAAGDAPTTTATPSAGNDAADDSVDDSADDAVTDAADDAPADDADAPTAIVAPEALQFSAPLVGGGEIELAGYAGQPVLLWFWSPF